MLSKEKKEINIIVGENIRLHRDKLGYSREKLAELIEVSPRFLYDAETGSTGISITTLKKLCEVLGISADRLLWKNTDNKIDISERLSHLPDEYMGVIDELIQKQLEIISLASKNDYNKKARN